MPREDGIGFPLLEEPAAVRDRLARNGLQSLGQRHRLWPRVRLEVADHEVNAALAQVPGKREHLERLADARGVAEKNGEPSARGVAHGVQCGKTRTSRPSARRM